MLYMWMIFSMSYKIMKTKWYKLNIGNKKIIYRKTVDGLFSFLPKLSQTFLYLEVEKATDQNLNQKAGSALWELNELASPPESCQIGFRISPRTIGSRMKRNRGLHWNIAVAMVFWAKRRINNDTPEWCRPGGGWSQKAKGNGRIIVKRVCELLTRASSDGIFKLPNG